MIRAGFMFHVNFDIWPETVFCLGKNNFKHQYPKFKHINTPAISNKTNIHRIKQCPLMSKVRSFSTNICTKPTKPSDLNSQFINTSIPVNQKTSSMENLIENHCSRRKSASQHMIMPYKSEEIIKRQG